MSSSNDFKRYYRDEKTEKVGTVKCVSFIDYKSELGVTDDLGNNSDSVEENIRVNGAMGTSDDNTGFDVSLIRASIGDTISVSRKRNLNAPKRFASDFLVFDEASGKYIEDEEQIVRDDVEKNHWLSILRVILKDWRLYLMLIPMLLVFFFWRYMPMYELIGAFKQSGSASQVEDQVYVGFTHFKTLFDGTSNYAIPFWRAFRNTFLLSFYGLCFGFPMPIIIALFFNEIRSNGLRSIYQVMVYLPKFMSTVVMTTLVTMILKKADLVSGMGIVSQFMVKIGIITEDIGAKGLLWDTKYFRAIYQISGIWETAGYDSIIFFAAVIAVSPTSYEAAQIDGAGKLAQMRYVVLPSILSTIVIMLITRIGSLLNVGYEKVLLLYQPETYETADVVSTFSQRFGIEGSQQALASAAEMINNVIGMILVIGANTIARKASDVSLY